jgi:5-methylcytosine-specific restriction protein A
MFEIGKEYRRSEIHKMYGGQEQGGISTPRDHRMIFLFTSARGKEHGYVDGWHENGEFHYTGEGQFGDMMFTRGNKAIRDHQETGKEIFVFKQTRTGYTRYIGQVQYINHHLVDSEDTDGKVRRCIIFRLKPIGEFLA